VAGGISEALVVTAFGLLIAIPAVLLFNSLSTRADRIHHGLGAAAGQFVDHIEFRHGLVHSTPEKEIVERPRSTIHAEASPDISIA
jgi:biopolymer transport protein ExbB